MIIPQRRKYICIQLSSTKRQNPPLSCAEKIDFVSKSDGYARRFVVLNKHQVSNNRKFVCFNGFQNTFHEFCSKTSPGITQATKCFSVHKRDLLKMANSWKQQTKQDAAKLL